ncbi:hypothetical protein [Streptomyces sp. NPDC026673]|uniref:hypothetical protein n=1 Tax=Streptomyces sp. NPDC026673 TaxID=3155724 RepID=UPI0034079816
MDESGVWLDLCELPATSASRGRCTWHGDSARPCPHRPVVGVRDRGGARWSACAAAARAVAADRGVPLPPGLAAPPACE